MSREAHVREEAQQQVGTPQLVAATVRRQQVLGGEGRERRQPGPQLPLPRRNRVLGHSIQGVLPLGEQRVAEPAACVVLSSGSGDSSGGGGGAEQQAVPLQRISVWQEASGRCDTVEGAAGLQACPMASTWARGQPASFQCAGQHAALVERYDRSAIGARSLQRVGPCCWTALPLAAAPPDATEAPMPSAHPPRQALQGPIQWPTTTCHDHTPESRCTI